MATTTSSSAFDVVLSDDFSAGYNAENWGQPFGGGTYWNGMFQWSKDDVAVRDGAMEVTVTRQADGSWTTGGFSSFKADKTITYGKIEFDGKVEESQGTMGVFLTWPKSDTWPVDGEIDILETPGQDVMHTTHFEDGSGEHQFSSVRNQSYDETQWNRYELTWLPDRMTLQVNGDVVAEWTDPAEIPDVAHGFGAMGMVASNNDGWMGGAPDGSTPDVTTIYMDNVVMSQWNGGPIHEQPEQPEQPKEPEQPPVELTVGTGTDTLVLKVSQNAYQGSAQYTVSVDGRQIGGTFTASALKSSGQSDTLTLKGEWGPGAHNVEVNFINDHYDANADWSRPELVTADRNLYVESATYNGSAVSAAAKALMSGGPASFAFTEAATIPPRLEAGTGPDTLELKISQDAYQGDAQYTVSVDGKQVGGTFTASASHAAGQSDTLTLKGDWAAGVHNVEVTFLNDKWDGTAATDRNLYLDAASFNGQAVEGAAEALMSAGAASFAFTEVAPPVVEVGTAGADLFDVTGAGGVFTGGAGRDLFVFEAGDGHVAVQDFASRTDKLVFVDFSEEDVTTAQATEGGVAGLLVTYGEDGSIFLAGVSSLGARDMVFA